MPNKIEVDIDDQKHCLSCSKWKKRKTSFFKSYNKWHKDGLVPYCKNCLKDGLDENNIVSVVEVLRVIDKPYFPDTWIKAQNDPKETLGKYLTLVNLNNSYDTYADSRFDERDEQNFKDEPTKQEKPSANMTKTELMDKWGFGYTEEEYEYFEHKYNTLRNNYQEKTSMHTEALLTYIRYRVKEELATAKNDNKAAKDWGTLASNAAKDAKINPAQLSQADLSDGLDTFGQLVRAVETNEDIIPILPQFKEKPHDKVDFALWCYINYIRDMQGKDLAEYKDIYEFYEDRKKEYEEDFVHESVEKDG